MGPLPRVERRALRRLAGPGHRQEREDHRRGHAPIVIVGTTRDPATPYEWATRLDDQLANGVLITLDGDGHTGYPRSNPCVDDAVDGYSSTGRPADG